MVISLTLEPSVAEDLRADRASACRNELLRVVLESHGEINPLHPYVNNPRLNRFFVVHADDTQSAEVLAERLRKVQGVEAAYVKPADELPTR